MEDAATAEISRAQIWQWIKHEAKLDDGRTVTLELYKTLKEKQLSKLTAAGAGRFAEAAEIFDRLVESKQFPEFLTVPAYEYLRQK
jgi:malate synthase